MNLIKTSDYEGYLEDDIKKELNPTMFQRFREWMCGQTAAIHNGKFLVYRWDYDRFLDGLEPFD